MSRRRMWLLALFCAATAAGSATATGAAAATGAEPRVELPVGLGPLAAFRVTTPGERRSVSILARRPEGGRLGQARGRSRPSSDAAGEGWLLCADADWHGPVRWSVDAGLRMDAPVSVGPVVRALYCGADRAAPRALVSGLGLADGCTAAHITGYDDLPPWSQALAHLQAIVLDAPGLAQHGKLPPVLAAYALTGGTLILRTPALAEAASAPELAALLPRAGVDPSVDGMAWRPVGRGWLVVITRGDASQPDLWARLSLNTGLGCAALGDAPKPVEPAAILAGLDDSGPRQQRLVTLYLVAYLVCLIPWHWRRRGWAATPLIATLVLGVLMLLQPLPWRRETVCLQATALSAADGQPWAAAETWLGLSTASYQSLDLPLPPTGGVPQWRFAETRLTRLPNQTSASPDGAGRVHPCFSRGNRLHRATRRWSEDLGGPIHLDLTAVQSQLTGSVRNGSRRHLRRAVVVWEHWCWTLGDLAPGARVSLPSRAEQFDWDDDALLRRLAPDVRLPQRAVYRGWPWQRPSRQPTLLAAIDTADDRFETLTAPRLPERVRLLSVAAAAPPDPPPGRRMTWQGQPWLVRTLLPADRNAAALRLVAEQDGVRVWVPADQRWEQLGGRAVTLQPASRYLNHGMLVVGQPYQPNAPTRDGLLPNQFDIGLAEPKPADYNGSG